MNRRSFLRSTAVAATGVATLEPPLRALAAIDPRRIKVGFLGVAYSHAAEKIRLLRQSQDFEFQGIWAETEALGCAYSCQGVPVLSQDQVLERAEVIVVDSEVSTHAAHAKLALAAGRHVHLEKPPALSLAEFDELVSLAREKKCLLQVGYMWRHHPGLKTAFDAAHRGWLGEVFLVRGTIDNSLEPPRRAEWAGFKGGVLFELGSHLVDATVRLLGRPDRVTSVLKTHGSPDDRLADNNVAVFEYARSTAVITSSTLQPNAFEHRAFEILGTRGTALISPLEPPILQLDLAQAAGPYKAGRQTVPLPEFHRYAGEFVELARTIQEDGWLPVSLEQEREVQETLLRACQAVRSYSTAKGFAVTRRRTVERLPAREAAASNSTHSPQRNG